MHIHCPVCLNGWVFQDARGGYECSECDARFNIERQPPQGYGGPRGPLGLLEQFRVILGRAILPRVIAEPDADLEPVVIDTVKP